MRKPDDYKLRGGRKTLERAGTKLLEKSEERTCVFPGPFEKKRGRIRFLGIDDKTITKVSMGKRSNARKWKWK